MSNFQNLLEKRRTIYQLGKDVSVSKEEITSLIKNAVKQAPSAFHSQSSRVVVLFGDEHTKLWNIAEDELRKIVPAEQFAASMVLKLHLVRFYTLKIKMLLKVCKKVSHYMRIIFQSGHRNQLHWHSTRYGYF